MSGRVQRSDSQTLISAELINTEHDRVVWTQTFDETDGSREDICGKIATTVGYMAIYHSPLAPKSGTRNAVRLQLAARIEMDKQTDVGIDRAEELNRMAVDADPTRPEGYLGLAFTFHQKFELGLGPEEPEEVLRQADEYAEKAVSIAPGNPSVLFARGAVYLSQGRLDHAIACYERALQLNPSNSALRASLAEAHIPAGNIPAALEQIDIATRPGVVYPDWQNRLRAFCLWAAGRNDEALASMRRDPLYPTGSLPEKCAILIANGLVDEAREVMAQFMAARPKHTVAHERLRFSRFRNKATRERWTEAMRTAGMPE